MLSTVDAIRRTITATQSTRTMPKESAMYQPTPGDRVRITRRRPDSSIKFVKVGTVTAADSHGFAFAEFGCGPRYVASSRSLADGMAGWTQTIERLAA